ncbi:MAG: hypothetical protein M0039_04510 [Pseudomonadota bacterium]|nr:hypothetical protein [Pseudomonadota bacterium]
MIAQTRECPGVFETTGHGCYGSSKGGAVSEGRFRPSRGNG